MKNLGNIFFLIGFSFSVSAQNGKVFNYADSNIIIKEQPQVTGVAGKLVQYKAGKIQVEGNISIAHDQNLVLSGCAEIEIRGNFTTEKGAFFSAYPDNIDCERNNSRGLASKSEIYRSSEKLSVPNIVPNPNNGHFNIILPDAGLYEIAIVGIDGRIIHTLLVSGRQKEFNLQNISSGLYIVTVKRKEDDRLSWRLKFIRH